MRPKLISYTPAALDADGFKNDATGATTTLTATSAADSLAHKVTIASAANLAAITFTLTGTDPDGKAQTEAVTGPNNSTVTSTKYFLTLTAVTFSATLGANTADIGWAAAAVSKTYPIDRYAANAFSLDVQVTGTINMTIQETLANVQSESGYLTSFSAVSALTGITGNTKSQLMAKCSAFRLLVNAVTAGATVSIYMEGGGDKQ